MGKFSLQLIIEELLLQNNISPTAESYYLKLSMPSQNISLEIGKFGEQVIIAFQNKDLISDPVFSFDYNEGFLIPVQFETNNGELPHAKAVRLPVS